jgi:hypothetical protein
MRGRIGAELRATQSRTFPRFAFVCIRRKCVKWTRYVGVTFPSVCLHVSSLKHLDTFLWNVALSAYSGSCPGKVILVLVGAVNVPTASAFYVELRSILIHVPRHCPLWNNYSAAERCLTHLVVDSESGDVRAPAVGKGRRPACSLRKI